MKDNYHRRDQNSPPLTGEEYYKVVEDTPVEGFTAEEYYKIIKDTPVEGFTVEECYRITEGPEQADSLETLDKPPKVERTQKHKKVEDAVKDYFSESFFGPNFEIKPKQNIDISDAKGELDLALYVPKKGKYVVIAEVKRGIEDTNYGRLQLFAYLCATNTRFGIFANSLDRNDWIFYENLRHFRFRRIEVTQFEKEISEDKYEMPDKPLRSEYSKEDFDSVIKAMSKCQISDVQYAIKTYFSHILQPDWECKEKNKKQIWVNTSEKFKIADLVLSGQDGSYVAIIEFRDDKSYPKSILFQLLCATDTRFGIIAGGQDPKKWKFYERQGSNPPSEIKEGFEFTAKMIAQAKETACPVFKGEVLPKKRWNEYRKTWKTLKAERVGRVTKIFHPDCPFTVGKELSDAEGQKARESYTGCPVNKSDIITKAKLVELRKTWTELVTKSVWRVTEAFHSGFPFTVGQYMSHIEYKQARVDYPGCPVKRGDILTKTEWEKYKRTWKGVNAELVWYVTNAEYERTQIEYQSLQNERDISRSKIKLWQFVTVGVSLFLVCFGVLFLMQRRATEDAVRQIATLVNQRTQKETEIRRNDWKIQSLTTSVQNVNSKNEILSQKISELENQERNRTFPINESVVRLRKQLNEEKNENQTLQSQLNKKDTEIRQLQNDITIARNENRRLQNQTDGSNSGIINQNDTVQRLKKEKAKVFNENQRLRDQNQDLIRQNQNWQDKNEALQKRLDDTKENNPNQAKKLPSDSEGDPQPTIPPQMENPIPEAPKKIQEDRTVRSVDISRNRQGCFAFEGGDYDKAIRQFEQVIKSDSELEIAHYNLGCTFLEMKDYPKAISAFDEAVAINHNFKEAHYNLGLVHFRNGAREQAKSFAERALRIDKNYQRARSLLAIIEKAER